jgi:hypothetical protein
MTIIRGFSEQRAPYCFVDFVMTLVVGVFAFCFMAALVFVPNGLGLMIPYPVAYGFGYFIAMMPARWWGYSFITLCIAGGFCAGVFLELGGWGSLVGLVTVTPVTLWGFLRSKKGQAILPR